jgi:ribosomal protein L11 methyltransferase
VIRLAVRVAREQAEIALAELLELAPGGVEEVDISAGVVEYAVYGASGELPTIGALRASVGSALVEVSAREIADDWSERWRAFHRPLVLPGGLTVRPPWEPAGDTALDVVIDPGRAFGTGAHDSTRLCLELLLELPVDGIAGAPVIDLGCGSGVLAIVAAKLGHRPLLALDCDAVAVQAAKANAAANRVALATRRFDLRSESLPAARLVLANLLGPLLLRWADALTAASADVPERVIAGGLLRSEAEEIAAAFAAASLHERERRARGEWAALRLERVAN